MRRHIRNAQGLPSFKQYNQAKLTTPSMRRTTTTICLTFRDDDIAVYRNECFRNKEIEYVNEFEYQNTWSSIL